MGGVGSVSVFQPFFCGHLMGGGVLFGQEPHFEPLSPIGKTYNRIEWLPSGNLT